MNQSSAASLLAVVSGNDYRPVWNDGSIRNKESQTISIGYYSPTYFALYNNTSSTIVVTVWTMDTYDTQSSAYLGSGVTVNIPAYGTFPVYLGKATWTGSTGDILALGSLTPSITR